MNYLEIIKSLKNFVRKDWGMDRLYITQEKIYTFTFRDKPNSNANDIIHLMIRDNEFPEYYFNTDGPYTPTMKEGCYWFEDGSRFQSFSEDVRNSWKKVTVTKDGIPIRCTYFHKLLGGTFTYPL